MGPIASMANCIALQKAQRAGQFMQPELRAERDREHQRDPVEPERRSA